MSDPKETLVSNEAEPTSGPPVEARTVNFEAPDSLVGQLLDGRFRIEKNLTEGGADEGGIGVVYLAKDMKLMGRKTVVKILHKKLLGNGEIARKFQHEKEALIRLDHPNIVRILDSGDLSDGNPFMVMEHIPGHSLRRLLKENGALPLDLAAHITESVTSALGTAHSNMILHRDIKPENIMLSPQDDGFDRVRLIDFGIARVGESQLAPVTTVPCSMGSIHYIAPEQLTGKLEQTPAVDIYSFAIVAYEMITGRKPFNPQTIANMFELQREGLQTTPGSLRAELPVEAERILCSALEFDSERRPQNIRAFGKELADALRTASADNMAETITIEIGSIPNTVNNIAERTVPISPLVGSARDTEIVPNNTNLSETPNAKRTPLYAVIAVLVFALIAFPAGIAFWYAFSPSGTETANNNNTNSNTASGIDPVPSAGPQVGLTYFLTVQKFRDGKPFEEPFKSTGLKESFESGYKFTLTFEPDSKGFLYVFHQGKDSLGETEYHLLFPTPVRNKGMADVTAGQIVETGNNTFNKGRGTEIVWVLWTREKIEALETVRESALDAVQGKVNELYHPSMQTFIERHKDSTLAAIEDETKPQAIVTAKGDVLIHKLELAHR